jgi:LCP family protein required for cell wall assembly
MSHPKKVRHKSKSSFGKKIILVSITFITLLILVAMFRLISFLRTISIDSAPQENNPPIKKVVTQYNILILGYGGGKHEGTYLTDTIIIANIDTLKKKILLISFPRDIWVKVPVINNEDFYSKINAVYQMGIMPKQYENIDKSLIDNNNPSGILKKVINDISGINPDYFLAIDFEGFIKIVDTLGGIEVNVEKPFTDYEYPIEENMNFLCGRDEEFAKIEPIINKELTAEEVTAIFASDKNLEQFFKDIKDRPAVAFPCRYEILSFNKGLTTMNGETALKFSRSRHALGDGGDFNRARRQQLVVNAVMDKVISLNFIPKVLPLLNDLEQNLKTDVSISEFDNFISIGNSISQYKISSLIISDKYLTDDYSSYGGSILVSKDGKDNWMSLKNDIKNIINEITPTPIPSISLKPTIN